MRITHLQVNHLTCPLGFDLGMRPTFSWLVEDARGTASTSARIVVSHAGGKVADTGWKALSPLATPVDLPLMPRTRYEWRVSVKSDAGEESTSDPAWFETGKLKEPWQARWLTCDYEEPRHPIFSRRLSLRTDAQIVDARLYICGLGLYETTIDGTRVGDERLAPGTHAYDQWLQYQTYDVTDLVTAGSTISVMLGHGWYSGRFGFVKTERGHYGNDWRLIAELHIAFDDGTEEVVGTDESWLVGRSNIAFSNIYDGEWRDDTLCSCATTPASLLDKDEAAQALGKLHDRLSPPVTPHETFSPTLVRTPSGDTVLDLGQNIAGTFRLRVDEAYGTQVRLQFGELLQDGEFYRDNLRTARAEYRYVSGGAPATIEPHFTYYGYRYVRVEGITDLDPADFVGIALYSDFDAERGLLTTGSDKVNQLVSNVRWGMRGNFVDTPTDCPQRDERMGWTGDANVFSATASHLGAPYAFYRKYLHDMACEQAARDGKVPLVVPSFGIDMTAAVWGDATTFIPWNMYEIDGDPSILAEHFDAMRSWVDWLERVDGKGHVWGDQDQLGDWLALDGHDPAGRRGGTDEGLIAYVYYWRSASIVADAAWTLGHTDDALRYDALAERVRSWIEGAYYTKTGRCAVNTQTAYVLSLVYDFGDKDWSARQLRRLLQENGGRLATGFVGTPLLCPALSAAGLDREAYDLLLNEDYPGWLFAVGLGATTVWERWDSLDASGHITGTEMNSMNHYSYGAVVEWLWSYAAGLLPVEPGFARAHVSPRPSWRLGSLEARLRTAAGSYHVAWDCLDECHLHVAITVPFDATADVELPFAPEDAYLDLGGRTLRAGSYEVTYETTEPLRRTPCVDWTIGQILDDPAANAVARAYVDGFDFCALGADKSKTLRELQADGFGQNEKMSMSQLDACDVALRALADRRPEDRV